MRALTLAAVAVVLCAASIARAQTLLSPPTLRSFSTDRPDRTESPYTVPAGWLQLESDIVSRGRLESGDQTVTSTSVASFNLKYGITPRFDMQFVFSPWIQTRTESPGVNNTSDETGQAGLRVKYNLFGNASEGSAAGLLPFVLIPTRGDPVFSAATWGLLVPVTMGVTENVSLGSMLGATRVDNDEWWVIGSASLGISLTEKLGGFLETYVARAGFESDALDDVTVDAGVTFLPRDNWQLDTGVYYGLTDDTEHWRVFVGASTRFSLSS